MAKLRMILAGFGNVGREVVRLLLEAPDCFEEAGMSPVVVAVSTRSRGAIVAPQGLDLEALRHTDWRGQPLETEATIRRTEADVLVEMTPLNVFSGQPAISHVEAALTTGKHVVLANKGPVAWRYDRLHAMAKQHGKHMLFESTVMDGTPVFDLVRHCLRGCRISGFSGVLNTTTNFVLDKLAEGIPAADAVKEAQRLGFAEADPTLDLEGYDAATKVAVLANVLMGAGTNPLLVKRKGITGITSEDAVAARSRGMAIRVVCKAAREAGGHLEASVEPVEVPLPSLFGQVSGTSSVLTLRTDLMGDISVFEHDPTITQTAYGVISDLIQIAREEVDY